MDLNIIGCGRAGSSLARLWVEAGTLSIAGVMNRSAGSTQIAIDTLGAGTPVLSLSDFDRAAFWMIGTGDDQIAEVARRLSHPDFRDRIQGATVFHLAGRHGATVLRPLEEAGCRVAAVHPVRSLTHARLSVAEFSGTACVVEGSEDCLADLEPLFKQIGGVWLPVSELDRGLYHAAVSIISNVTKAVAWKAQNWLNDAGLDDETAAIVTHKLLFSTMADLDRSGARQSITGPVVRGDTSTVAAHIAALQTGHAEDVDIYRVLARTVLELARERGDLDASTLERFKSLLKLDGATAL
jgi:predicted short-subunit dehydrogenase-like oxidoreductase (DUF2520 family)